MPSKKIVLPKQDQLLPTAAAEQYIHLSRRQLHRLANDGLLTRFYVGSRLRWHTVELDALLSRSKRGSARAS